jgi:hypothetical protein
VRTVFPTAWSDTLNRALSCVCLRQEYDSSDGEIGTSDSEGELAPVEPIKEKKIDDDEDRRNPQYIPKRGTFYEHDDRTADDDTR